MHLPFGEQLHYAVLYAPIGICILDANTFVAEIVNEKFVEVAGKPYEDIIGRFYWDVFSEVRALYEKALTDVALTGNPYHADEVEMMLIRHGKKETVFVTFVYAPVKNDQGNVIKIAVWVLENTGQVTERQKQAAAKAALQIERDRLKSLFMQAPAGICILAGPELTYELVNPAYQQILSGRRLLDRPIFEAMPELVGTPIQQMLLDIYHKGIPYEMSEILVPVAECEGGPTSERYFSFSFHPRRDDHNNIDGIVNIVTEVTRMVKIQEELKEAKVQADKQKRVYETITSGTPDLMYVFDLDYRFTYANNALLTMWGKTWEEAIGKGLLDNGYEPWHADMHEREIDKIRETKVSIRGEVAFPHAVLGKRIYDYILIPVFNEQGEVEAVAGTTRDVTDRKSMEETLENNAEELHTMNEELISANEEQAASNEELATANDQLALVNNQLLEARYKVEEAQLALRLAIEAANFGTWFIHSDTRQLISNARLKELFGFNHDEVLTIELCLSRVTDEFRDDISQKLEEAIYHGGNFDVIYPVIGFRDGELRWLRAIGNLQADPLGSFSAFTGVIMDITEQHLAAQKIQQTEEDLRMAIESGELAVWHMNERHERIEASGRFNELFGFAPGAEITYQDAINRIMPEFRQIVHNAVSDSFETGAKFYVEYPLTGLNDGKQRWVRSIGKYVKDEKAGNYITGVMSDITEQKMDEIRKNDFIGMVSHELKTPLTSLTLGIQMLESKLQESEDEFTVSILSKAGLQVKKMNSLINGFLNISRLESSKLQLVKNSFELNDLISETINESFVNATTHTIQLKKTTSLTVMADRDKIGSVISNLLSNAIKYSPYGAFIEVNCYQQKDVAIVSVKDEGLGIKDEDLERIFDRYYRVEDNRKKFISGFGIGLYLCAEIVKRHGGNIWVDSEFGRGSTFYFSIPVR